MKKTFTFVFILIINFTYAQISEIKENYFVDNNGTLEKTYFDLEKFSNKPFYEYFISSSKDFFPSYYYNGRYEVIYKYQNNKLIQCENIDYSKEKELINFKYDGDNNLTSISSTTRTLNYTTKYKGRFIEINEGNSKFNISTKNNLTYKVESGKAGYFYFYHNTKKNTVEMLVPKKQYKIVYKYKDDRIYEVLTYQKGEILNTEIINYENDSKGNWIKKVIKNKNGKTYVVTREIQYL